MKKSSAIQPLKAVSVFYCRVCKNSDGVVYYTQYVFLRQTITMCDRDGAVSYSEGTCIMDKESFLAFLETIRGQRVFVQTHNFPDPDAIGSGFGLVKLLEHFDIKSELVFVGQIDRLNTRKMTDLCHIDIFSFDELEKPMDEADPVICIDSQKFGGNIKDLPGDEVACIDHHPLVNSGESFRYLDVRKAGSCSTLIAEYFKELNIEPDEDVATALLYGLKMDTMHFTRGVTYEDIKIYEYLFRYASKEKITDLEQNNMEYSDLKAYGAAIENIEIFGSVGFAGIPFACPDARIATVADFILSLDEVDVAILYALRKDGYKFSVRSNTTDVDAGKLVAEALKGIGNGGGHSFMAGGFLPESSVEKLGVNSDARIRELFLSVISGHK